MTSTPHTPEATLFFRDPETDDATVFAAVAEITTPPLSTRLLGQDIPAAKKIAAQYLPDVSPSTRIELLARSLGYRTAAAFQAGFRAVPATPEVIAIPLMSNDPEGPAFGLLASLSQADQKKAAELGAHVIAKILQGRFRVAKSAPNKQRQISISRLIDLGPLAAGTLAARRIIAEARLFELAMAPLVIQEEDIREAWLSSGASAAPPRVEGVAAALLLAIDLGLDARAISSLDARHIKEDRIPLGTRVVAAAGQNARGALENWIGPLDRNDAAITPALLHGPDTHTAIEPTARCNPDSLDALVFAATGSKQVGLGPLTLRDAAVASHLILCAAYGKSVKGAARRLGVPERTLRGALTALGGPQSTRRRDQALATHLGITTSSARRKSDELGAIFEEGESALDIFVGTLDMVAAKQRDRIAEPQRAPVILEIEKASEATELVAIAKTDNKASSDHVAAYFKARCWTIDFTPSLLGRPRNPVNTTAREIIEVAWNEGKISKDGSTICVDWLDTHPIDTRRSLLLDGAMRLEVYGDNSACVLVSAAPGSVQVADLPDNGETMTRRMINEALFSGLSTRLDAECLPFPVNIRGTVTSPDGKKAKLGESGLISAILINKDLAANNISADLPFIETNEGRAALRCQLEREIEALHDYAAGRTLGVQKETPITATRNTDRMESDLPWNEPYHTNQMIEVSGHQLRLRWRLGDDPAHAHFSRDPYTRKEREWAREAIDLAVAATVGQSGVKANDLEVAITAPNLATGAPAGVMFLGHPLGYYLAEIRDPTAPDRIKRAKADLLERLAPVVALLRKPGFVYGFGREISPIKLARSRTKTSSADPQILDRRLKAHLDLYPEDTGYPGIK